LTGSNPEGKAAIPERLFDPPGGRAAMGLGRWTLLVDLF